MIQQNYSDSITNLQVQWAQADLDERTWLGDPNVWGGMFPTNMTMRRKMFNFNMTHSTIMMVTGHQRRNRKSTICIPVKQMVQKTSDQFTKCLFHTHKTYNGYDVYSDAFERGALVQGFGLISIFPDYQSDPISPDIRMRFVDFKSVMMDSFFRNKDLSDCRFIHTRQYFSKEESKLLYPEQAYEIDQIPTGGALKDDKFYFMPENYGLQQNNLLAFDEYWYLSPREATYAVDVNTEEVKEIFGDEEDIRVILYELKDKIKIIKRPKQSIRRCIVVNGRVMQDKQRPYGIDRHSHVGVYGNFNPDTPYIGYKFKGIVRDMRDSQFLYDIRKGTDLDILSSQQQGIKVKKGALLTPDDALNNGNGRVLVVNDKMSMDDVQPMEIIPPSPVMLQMEEMLKTAMREISGVNEELLGAAVDDKAGVLSMLRQGSGLTTLQKYFDELDYTQKQCGDIQIQMMQHFWTYGKVRQIIGEDPTPEFDNKAFFEYGAKVVQGVMTETQQQLELAQLFELQQRFGDIFPAEEIIEVMTIQNKDRIMEKMAANLKAQQDQQQKMAELQMQQISVDNQTKIAYAHSQQSLGEERIARIQTDRAIAEDKLARADREDTATLLNLVKTIKELDEMDLDQLHKKIQIINEMLPETSNVEQNQEITV